METTRRLKQRSKQSACGRASGRSRSDCMPKSRGERGSLEGCSKKDLVLVAVVVVVEDYEHSLACVPKISHMTFFKSSRSQCLSQFGTAYISDL